MHPWSQAAELTISKREKCRFQSAFLGMFLLRLSHSLLAKMDVAHIIGQRFIIINCRLLNGNVYDISSIILL